MELYLCAGIFVVIGVCFIGFALQKMTTKGKGKLW